MQVILDMVSPTMVGVTVMELHILLLLPLHPPLHLLKHLQLLMSERNVTLMLMPMLRLILNLGITVIMATHMVDTMAMDMDIMVDTMDIPMDMDITMANKQIKPKCKL